MRRVRPGRGRACAPAAPCGPGRHEPHGRRLFWRVYLQGIALLLAAGATAVLASGMWHPAFGWQRMEERIAEFVSEDLAPQLDDRAALQAKVDAMERIFEVGLAVYDRAGTLLAAAGAEPPAPVSEPPKAGDLQRTRGARVVGLDGERYLVAALGSPWFGGRGLLVVAAILGVLALVSLPLARAITRPLERLTDTARRFGRGELSARTGLRRRDEVGDLARAFDEMAERIEHLVRSEKELLANVSHELRTPMARIRVALELCSEDSTPAEAIREHIRGIEGDLAELERLVDDVLTAARLDAGAGTFPMRRERVLLGGLVELAAERFGRAHPDHRLEALVDDEAATDAVDGDPVLLRRVLDNLLDNAAKFSDPAQGAVEIALARVADQPRLRVEVRDRGVGVTAEDLPHLARPFFRSDRSRDRGSGGVGLGLYLCRRVVEAHGGRLVPALREGGGLSIGVELPAAAPEPGAPVA